MKTLVRLPIVLAARGRRKTAHYSDIAAGLFTRGVVIGPRSVAWPQSELEEINAARIAGKSEEEVRALVERLHAARKAVTVQNVTFRPICNSCNGSGVNPNSDEECQDCSGSGFEPSSD